MTEEPEFEGFVYQIVIDGTSVIVMADWEDARKYVEDNLKSANVIILPVAVFKYGGGE